jgi:alpha-ketoglutaric semialdehyde dehydrogenase
MTFPSGGLASKTAAEGEPATPQGAGPPKILNYVDGVWIEGHGGPLVEHASPSDGSLVSLATASSAADVEAAAEAAKRAQPGWARLTSFRRARYLSDAARALEASARRIAADLTHEEGKTLPEAQAEVQRAIGVLDFFAGAGLRLAGSLHPSERDQFRIEVRREPIGVVAAITPWNFPIAIPAWKMAPALVAGNTVVLKPASLTPLTAANLVSAFVEAGLPPGVINMVIGPGADLGDAFVNTRIGAITFTGSTAVGRALYAAAGARGIRMQAEMGGHNPVVVLADADLEDASRVVANGAFMSTGQKCTATRRVIVEQPAYEQFLACLMDRAAELVVGDPMDPATDVGPIVSQDQLDSVVAAVERAVRDGAAVAFGGRGRLVPAAPMGLFFEPTVLTGVEPDSWVAQTEVFGPVLSVFSAVDLDDATRVANGVQYGLSAGICGRDINRIEAFVAASQSGVVTVNAPTAGMEFQVPVHGVKASGIGPPEQGDLALEFFTEVKTVYRRTVNGNA